MTTIGPLPRLASTSASGARPRKRGATVAIPEGSFPTRDGLEAAFTAALMPLARNWRLALDRALESRHLSAASAWALVTIAQLGGTARPTDIVDVLDINAASVVRLVDSLIEQGLAERSSDQADRRVRNVSLTASGVSVAGEIANEIGSARRRLLACVSIDDLTGALRAANAMNEALTAERPQCRNRARAERTYRRQA